MVEFKPIEQVARYIDFPINRQRIKFSHLINVMENYFVSNRINYYLHILEIYKSITPNIIFIDDCDNRVVTEDTFTNYEGIVNNLKKIDMQVFERVGRVKEAKLKNILDQITNIIDNIIDHDFHNRVIEDLAFNATYVTKEIKKIHDDLNKLLPKLPTIAVSVDEEAESENEKEEISMWDETALKKTMDQYIKQIKSIREEAKLEAKSAKKSAASAGIAVSVTSFAKEAAQFKATEIEHNKKAKWFLRVSILLGASLVIWGWRVPFLYSDKEADWAFIISSTVGKVIITGVLITGLGACLRGYFASLHNVAVNRQRYNALQSYKELAQAAESDPESKKFVLLKATECAYSHQATGFTKQHSESGSQSTTPQPIYHPVSHAGSAISKSGGEGA